MARSFVVPVSLSQSATWAHESRTLAQFEAVRAIVESPDFLASCNPDLFTPDVGAYDGPFAFAYYTKDGLLNVRRIGKAGRTLQHVTA